MKTTLAVSCLGLLVLGFGTGRARAACDFEHPRKAGSYSSSLVQAFLACENNVTVTTEGGIPACQPPRTFNDLSGAPADGWLWDERKAQGKVRFKAAKNKVTAFLGQPNTADLSVEMSLSGVFSYADGGGAAGDGRLAVVARATLEDRGGGGTTLTVVDFPVSFPFTMAGGKAKLKSSANVALNDIGQPGLPGCASIELVAATVIDRNGNPFAAPGTFLPDLPQ